MRGVSYLQLFLFWMLAIASATAQSARDREVDFGVNGHSLAAGPYSDMPLERQISLLQSLGLKTYRVNLNPTHQDKFARLSQLIAIAEHEKVRILPVVVLPPKQYSDENTAYNQAKSAMAEMAKQFDTRITVWELGNEYDLYSLKPGANGASPDDYDAEKYAVVRGLIRGMLAGLREASPSAKSIVETSQHTPTSLDSGFLERLIADGITYDITGYHYYSRDGRLPIVDGKKSLQILHNRFHKPIWITEFDQASIGRDLGPSSDPKAQGMALLAGMSEIAADAKRYDVVGADIYELLNEPQLLHSPGVNPCQAQFGILESDGRSTDASRVVQKFLRAY
jgi:Glycosyl hydrolase family 53